MNLLLDRRLIACMNQILARFAMTLRTETELVEGTFLRPSTEEKVNFRRNVDESLAQIRSTEVGSSLLDDIVRASHELVILRATPSVGNKCKQTEASLNAGAAACYKELLSFQSLLDKVQELTRAGWITEQHPAVKKFMKFCAPQAQGGNQEAYQYLSKQNLLPLAHKKEEQKQLEKTRAGGKCLPSSAA